MSEDVLSRPAPRGRCIPYGHEPSQFGELRLPPVPGPYPTVLLLHGGYWRDRYDLAYLSHTADALVARGFATWNVEYRRIGEPGGGWPGTFLDAATSIDILGDMAPIYGLDLSRLVVLGHSAGGQLALWLAGRSRIPPDSPLSSERPLLPAGVLGLAPVADLVRAAELDLSDGAVSELLGGERGSHPHRYAATSPPLLLPTGLPSVLLHGADDEDVPVVLSRSFADAAEASGDPVRLQVLPGTGHFELVDPEAPQFAGVLAEVKRLAAGQPEGGGAIPPPG